jgi:hypothetical protein
MSAREREMPELYQYVGPDAIRDAATQRQPGALIDSPDSLVTWARAEFGSQGLSDLLMVTYTVGEENELRVADRHAEHVACAGGGSVRAAGEMGLIFEMGSVVVEEASNQATGYCPEPGCWDALERVLTDLGIPHPGSFTRIFHFRRCKKCRQVNIVKDEWFYCAVCDEELPQEWNLG